jgi:hypothetical protein
MWYEKNVGIICINFILFFLITILLWFAQTYLLLCSVAITILIVIINMYNVYIAYNRGIDNTVFHLGKHYEKKIKEEIENIVKRIQSI